MSGGQNVNFHRAHGAARILDFCGIVAVDVFEMTLRLSDAQSFQRRPDER